MVFLNYTQTPLAKEDVLCVLDYFEDCFTENAWKLSLQERMLANFHFPLCLPLLPSHSTFFFPFSLFSSYLVHTMQYNINVFEITIDTK